MENFNMHFSKLLSKDPYISKIKNSIYHITDDSKTSNKDYELLQILVLSSLSSKEVCEVVFSNYLGIIYNIDNEEDKFYVLANVVFILGGYYSLLLFKII